MSTYEEAKENLTEASASWESCKLSVCYVITIKSDSAPYVFTDMTQATDFALYHEAAIQVALLHARE